MASSKAPKHDFAPPWLKIPEQEGLKPGASKLSEHSDKNRNRDYYNYRYNGPDYPPYGPPLPRQRSFDNYYDDRRYPPQKFRHHSVDDDYYGGYAGYGYYNGYGFERYGNQYRSQPTLYRDGKNPNARYNQMNGGYPGYYDHYGYDYYHGDPYYNSYMRPGNGGGGGKRSYGDRSKHDREKNREGKPGEKGDNSKEPLDDDFPSLNGESEESDSKVSKPNASGVWEKPLSKKLQTAGQPDQTEGSPQNGLAEGTTKDTSAAKANTSSNIYKALVPNKQAGFTRKTNNKDPKLNRDAATNGTVKAPTPTVNGNKPFSGTTVLSKESTRQQSPTQPVDILNPRLVSLPKNLGDKKSDFLKALKKDSPDRDAKKDKPPTENAKKVADGEEDESSSPEVAITNGIHKLSVSPEESLLSSSLEAEQRLLREMGWKEDEEEEYVITEDDMKQFQQLSKQIEGKNGLSRKKILPKTWSPHVPAAFEPNLRDLSDNLSSTSDDSDDDLS